METPTQPKKRRLTKKQRGFVNDYADTGNGTQSVLNNYEITSPNKVDVAKSIASENLTKPYIQEELRKLGFDSNNAKRVISEILNDDTLEPKDRIKAAENVFKVQGDYAPEKSINLNVEVAASEEIKEAAKRLNDLYRGTSEPSDGTLPRTVGNEA